MIVRLFNNPRMVVQTSDEEYGVAESAIAVSTDSGGTLVLEQEGRSLCLNRASVPDLIKALKEQVSLRNALTAQKIAES